MKKVKKTQNHLELFSEFVLDVPKIITNTKRSYQYDRHKMIGFGSFGKCFKITKRPSGQPFACKVLSKTLIEKKDFRIMVQNEIAIHRKLKHEHVIELVEAFEDKNHIYLIQQLCTNSTISEMMKHRGNLTVPECRYFVRQILFGTQYIHENKIIHRDLKPNNILIDTSMQVKICDFGLAIHKDDPRVSSQSICGTTNYLAPEALQRKGFVQRSDVWAIGVIAFFLLLGYKPFDEGEDVTTIDRIIRIDYGLPGDIDHDLKAILKKIFRPVQHRINVTECLQLPFFQNYLIPSSIPKELFPPAYCEENGKHSTALFNVNFSMIEDDVLAEVEYPEIRVEVQPNLHNSVDHMKYTQMLERLHQRLKSICCYFKFDNDNSISETIDLRAIPPEYWVVKWSYSIGMNNGFSYQISDGTIGIMFDDGLKLKHTPDNNYLIHENDVNSRCFRKFCKTDLIIYEEKLQLFNTLQCELDKSGIVEAETTFVEPKSPYLYTWLRTDEAMIMLLSNGTLQINFAKNHSKVVICPEHECITLIRNRICRKQFRTMTFSHFFEHGFSTYTLSMFKYITAIVKHLGTRLEVSQTI